MSEIVYELAYQPEKKHVVKGMQLACKPAFPGKWRWFLHVYSLLVGIAWAVLALVIVFLVLGAIKVQPSFWTYYIPWILVAVSFLSLSRVSTRRIAQSYLSSSLLRGSRLRMDAAGVTFGNSRSKEFTDWRDVVDLAATKNLLVLSKGATGIVLPNPLLSGAGMDPDEVRNQVKIWFDESRGQA